MKGEDGRWRIRAMAHPDGPWCVGVENDDGKIYLLSPDEALKMSAALMTSADKVIELNHLDVDLKPETDTTTEPLVKGN